MVKNGGDICGWRGGKGWHRANVAGCKAVGRDKLARRPGSGSGSVAA